MPKLEVFLSHRTTEARFADLIKERLDEDFFGIINLFYSNDITSVPVGSNWDESLLEGLRRATVMLALCSKHSVKLPWINFEVGGAVTRGVEIIPLCHSGITPGSAARVDNDETGRDLDQREKPGAVLRQVECPHRVPRPERRFRRAGGTVRRAGDDLRARD
jgi:hypothetical protein